MRDHRRSECIVVARGEGGAGWEITEIRRGPASLAEVVEEHAMHIFYIHTIRLSAYEYKGISMLARCS